MTSSLTSASDALPGPAKHAASSLPNEAGALALLRTLQTREAHQAPRPTTGPVLLYGAGQLGQMALAWCLQHRLNVLGVVDAAAVRWREQPVWQGTPVFAPEEVPLAWREEMQLLVCISTLPYAPLQAQLREQGWSRLLPFYDFVDAWAEPQPLNNGWRRALPGIGSPGARSLEQVLGGWHDDTSRAHHLQFLAWRCLREEWSFDAAPVDPDARYFIPELAACWRPGERVLDAGAYHGQMLDRWITLNPGWLDRAWAVEPDAANFAVLHAWRETRATHERERIELHDMALARRPSQRAFVDGQGYGSRLWSAGKCRVQVQAIDAMGWRPTFMKLHLEGGEWRALQGATRTMHETRPLLALTVYHRRDGLWPVARWLMNELPAYRWLFRLHGWQGTAAVIYGLPIERLPRAD